MRLKRRNWIERKLCYDLVRFENPKLLRNIVEAVARVLMLDLPFISMLREIRFIELLEKNLCSLSEDLFTPKFADALILFWESLKQSDFSEDSALLSNFLQNVLLNPSFCHSFKRDEVVAIHNAAISDFALLSRCLSADSYIDWILSTQLMNESAAIATLQQFAQNSSSFSPFYRGFSLIACEADPFPCILFLVAKFCEL